jgi:hypothetical protein
VTPCQASRLIAMLREDLRDEWKENHHEHCGCDGSGRQACHWQPSLALQIDDVDWLLAQRGLDQGEDAPYLGQHLRYGYLVPPEGHDSSGRVVVQEELVGRHSLNDDAAARANVVANVTFESSLSLGLQDACVDMFCGVPDGASVQDGLVIDAERSSDGLSLDPERRAITPSGELRDGT